MFVIPHCIQFWHHNPHAIPVSQWSHLWAVFHPLGISNVFERDEGGFWIRAWEHNVKAWRPITPEEMTGLPKGPDLRFPVTPAPDSGPSLLPSLEFHNPSADLRIFISQLFFRNNSADPVYQLRRHAAAFLQSQSASYVQIEFWGDHYMPLVAWISANAPK